VGGIAECKRLRFVHEDQARVMSLSTGGLSCLLDIHARGIRSVAEAFAAGRELALEEND
jgi:hypothetical protein